MADGRIDRVETAVDETAQTLVVRRGAALLACNLGVEPAEVAVPAGAEVRLASEEG